MYTKPNEVQQDQLDAISNAFSDLRDVISEYTAFKGTRVQRALNKIEEAEMLLNKATLFGDRLDV